MPTQLKDKPRSARAKAKIESTLVLARQFMMITAATLVMLILAQFNANSVAAAIRAGQLPVVTHLP